MAEPQHQDYLARVVVKETVDMVGLLRRLPLEGRKAKPRAHRFVDRSMPL
jgi:hypothetical protein